MHLWWLWRAETSICSKADMGSKHCDTSCYIRCARWWRKRKVLFQVCIVLVWNESYIYSLKTLLVIWIYPLEMKEIWYVYKYIVALQRNSSAEKSLWYCSERSRCSTTSTGHLAIGLIFSIIAERPSSEIRLGIIDVEMLVPNLWKCKGQFSLLRGVFSVSKGWEKSHMYIS